MRKILIRIIEIILGIVFILSALLKMNDPLGLAYKIKEITELLNLQFSANILLLLAIIFNTIELVLGCNMFFGFYRNLTKWAYTFFLLFFLAFTGYATATGVIKECGCMGNCFPLQSRISFIKDMVLIGLIAILFFMEYHHHYSYKKTATFKYVVIASLFGIFIQLFAYLFLPYIDCMPFKKGVSVTKALELYQTANQDSVVIEFVYKKNGKKIKFLSDNFPTNFDSTYTFVSREDKIIHTSNNKQGISEFALMNMQHHDVTEQILNEDTVYLFFVTNDLGWSNLPIQEIDSLQRYNFHYFIVANLTQEQMTKKFQERGLPLSRALIMDNITLITIARSPYVTMILQKGTIVEKRGMLTSPFLLTDIYDKKHKPI